MFVRHVQKKARKVLFLISLFRYRFKLICKSYCKSFIWYNLLDYRNYIIILISKRIIEWIDMYRHFNRNISHIRRIEIIRFWGYGRYSFRLSFYQIRFMVLSSLFVIKRKDNSLKVDETPKTDKRNWNWMGKNVGKRRCVLGKTRELQTRLYEG